MKKALTILIAIFFLSIQVNAQVSIIEIKPNNDSVLNNTTKQLLAKRNIDNMPVAGNNLKQTYAYNNSKGFNVYKAEPDNMPVLKPDAVNETSLKIKNAVTVQKNLEIARRLLDSAKTKNQGNFYQFKINPTWPQSSEKIMNH